MFHIENNSIYKLIPLENDHALVEIGSGNANEIRIRCCGDKEALSQEAWAEVIRYVREWFDLDTDLAPFYKLAAADPMLHEAVSRCTGLRLMGIPDLFEALIWGILGQQINLTFAYTLKRRFVETFGRHVEWNGRKFWLFPDPRDVAALSAEDMTGLQITGKKCEYITEVARLIAEGSLTKQQLMKAGSLQAAEKRLTSIRGIGPWTANYVLMRCLRYRDAFPIADVGLHNAIAKLLGMGHKPSVEQIRQMSAGWAGWEAYATFYLWRVLY
jgi:DNA-3-methyladenine glycosylase II